MDFTERDWPSNPYKGHNKMHQTLCTTILAKPKRPGGHRRSRVRMGLKLGVFGSGTHIPLVGSHLADFQGPGEGVSARRWGRQQAQAGGGCLVNHCSLVCKGGENQACVQCHCSDPPSRSGTKAQVCAQERDSAGQRPGG